MNHQKRILRQRQRRRWRVRKAIKGTQDRPRLSVFRSHKHLYVQLIDDAAGRTVAAASTGDKDLKGQMKYGGNREAAKAVGKAIAARALAKGITKAAFDRREYQYHGRIAALADAAREGGLSV